jgi:predicted CopG family antitoxin
MYLLHLCDRELVTKTVALDEEAYELLRRVMTSEESFSDAVKRLAGPRRPLSEFAGMWGNMSAKERRDLDRVYADLHEADRRRAERIRGMWR